MREAFELAEAARSLGLSVDASGRVHSSHKPDEYAAGLVDVVHALERFDAAAGQSAGQFSRESLEDALRGLFRWLKDSKVDLGTPFEIVRRSLVDGKVKADGRGKRHVPRPRFAANGWKRDKKSKPELALHPDDERITASEIRKHGFKIQRTIYMMGNAGPATRSAALAGLERLSVEASSIRSAQEERARSIAGV
jgi:hypothetical protein